MGISLGALIFVCFFVFLAGFVDAAAGGGGLISLPAYLFVGIPTHAALGCNKFSAACGTTFSAFRFFKNGVISKKIALISAVFSFTGSYFGMQLALSLDQDILKTVLIIILPIIAVFLLVKRDFGNVNNVMLLSSVKSHILASVVGLLIGFYDGLLGPGTGTFAIIAFSTLMKFDLKTASGNAKILNLASGYAAMTAALLHDKVIFSIAVPAAIFGILGNYIGSGFAIKKGAKFIRPLMILVIILLFAKLFYDVFGNFF